MNGYRFAVLSNGHHISGRFRVGQMVRTPYGARRVVAVGYHEFQPADPLTLAESAHGVQ